MSTPLPPPLGGTRRTLSGDGDADAPPTTRRRVGGEDLEVGRPPELITYGDAVLEALSAAASGVPDRGVAKKDVAYDGSKAQWQRMFDPGTLIGDNDFVSRGVRVVFAYRAASVSYFTHTRLS